ncbi:MAG: PRC-barrel domain-containing protein [Nocardioidaceae bacterium]
MLFSEAKKHKVVSSSSAATVGKVSSFLVDPVTRSVLAMRLKKTEDGHFLRWSDITAFGVDAVTVTGADKIGDGDDDVKELSGKDHRVLGKRLLSSAGDELGKVEDVDFDPATGALVALLAGTETVVAAERLLGIGSYAVVVRDEP